MLIVCTPATFRVPRSHQLTVMRLVVDGHFKTQFAEEKAAKKAATELRSKGPMLQVEIYDGSSKSRTLVK